MYQSRVRPRIILHGGAGNITRETIPPERLVAFRTSLLSILKSSHSLLMQPQARALEVAVHAVSLLEDDPLFNCGKGAVFNRSGKNELEASVMVSDGYRKRGVGCMLLKTVKNPIKLAREMLIRGEEPNGGGCGAHNQLSGEALEQLAETWGVEIVNPSYFWTKERWDQHKRGLQKGKRQQKFEESALEDLEDSLEGNASWDPNEYVPQGTVGAVVLDSFGTIAVATSTGGLTNKLPGRIGDTPTLGAGFWAETWIEEMSPASVARSRGRPAAILDHISRGYVGKALSDCLSLWTGSPEPLQDQFHQVQVHTVGLSGTGNGDSFLRLSAARSTAAMSKFSSPNVPLSIAVTKMAGPQGELEQSAGEYFNKAGEGEGGIIAIELIGDRSEVSFDYNRGMFRAYMDENDSAHFGAFRE
jgi:L-asparaginase